MGKWRMVGQKVVRKMVVKRKERFSEERQEYSNWKWRNTTRVSFETCGNFPFWSKENEDEVVEENTAEHFWRSACRHREVGVTLGVRQLPVGEFGEECHRVGRASHLAQPLRRTSYFIFFLTLGEAPTGYFTWIIPMSAVAWKLFFLCAFLQMKKSAALLLPSEAGAANRPLPVPLEDNNCLLHCANNNAPKTQSTHWNNDIRPHSFARDDRKEKGRCLRQRYVPSIKGITKTTLFLEKRECSTMTLWLERPIIYMTSRLCAQCLIATQIVFLDCLFALKNC